MKYPPNRDKIKYFSGEVRSDGIAMEMGKKEMRRSEHGRSELYTIQRTEAGQWNKGASEMKQHHHVRNGLSAGPYC